MSQVTLLQLLVNNFAAVSILIFTGSIVQFYQKVENRRDTLTSRVVMQPSQRPIMRTPRAHESISTRRTDIRNHIRPMTNRF